MKSAGMTPITLVALAIQRDRTIHDVSAAAEVLLPCGITEDHGAGRGRQIFAIVEVPAEDGRDAESAKKAIADAGAVHGDHAGGSRERGAGVGVDLERAERFVVLLPIEVIGVGEIALRTMVGRFENADQPVGVFVWQGLDQRGIHKDENRHAGTDSESQHEDGGAGENEVVAQLPEGECDVSDQIFHKVQAALIAAHSSFFC